MAIFVIIYTRNIFSKKSLLKNVHLIILYKIYKLFFH